MSQAAQPDRQDWFGDLDSFVTLMVRVAAKLRSVGLELKGGSRLYNFNSRLYRLTRPNLKDNTPALAFEELGDFLEGLRDAEEIAVIVDQFLPSRHLSVPDKLIRILGGATSAVMDSKPLARNLQSELYIAALLEASGFKIHFEEPDLVCYVDGVEIGVAAKRAASEAHLEKLLREGGRQLRNAKVRGIVAVSLDRIVGTQQIWASADHFYTEAADQNLMRLIDAHEVSFNRALSGTPAHGILATAVLPTVLSSGPPKPPTVRIHGIGKVNALVVLDAGDSTTDRRVRALSTLQKRLVFPKTFGGGEEKEGGMC